MKIAIAAAHGVGKSSFAKGLAKELGLSYIHDIVVEEAFPKGFVINENTPPEVQMWLVTRQWELEKLTPEDWIADKCLLDYLIYGEIVLRDENLLKVIRDIVLRNAKYDVMFYIPIEFPLPLDGIRSPDPVFQKKVDEHYKKFLDDNAIKYFVLPGSIEERIRQAREILKK